MASFCRAALMAGSRSFATKSKILDRGVPTYSLLSSTARPFFSASRALSTLRGVKSLMPLHSAVASARLKSNISIDSSYWSWLSRVPSSTDGLLVEWFLQNVSFTNRQFTGSRFFICVEEAIKKRRKEAFFTALGRQAASSSETSAKVNTSIDAVGSEPPPRASLQDNYVLTNSKLRDWDKMQESIAKEDMGKLSEDGSSDDGLEL